jgi:voltage-gated potassium channel
MGFEATFLHFFFKSMMFMAPTLLALVLAITTLGWWVGRIEQWSFTDSIYYAFITATTVGYGDLHPVNPRSKFIAVAIALVGILFTGIIVALAVTSASYAFDVTHDIDALKQAYRDSAR